MNKIKIILSLLTFMVAMLFAGNNPDKSSNKANDWQILFNGKNLDGWVVKIHHHEVGDNYAGTFRVKDGKIQVNYDDYKEFGNRYGHLFYKDPFSSYHLKFEYRFTDQWLKDAASFTYRNSGVMFHAQDPQTILKEQDWPISIEFQLLAGAGDGKPRPTGNMCSPGTDVFINNEKIKQHCLQSSSKTYEWDEWITGELIVYRDSLVQHIINGDMVMQYAKPQIGGGVVTGFDQEVKIDGKPLTSGYIGLQSEGQGIEFRKIMIMNLD
jgi:hypothetical protein